MSEVCSRCPAPLTRIRHLRGHGVHSPFAYSLVRNAFMKGIKVDKQSGLYSTLISSGISKKYSGQIYRIAEHCGYSVVLDANHTTNDKIMFVASPSYLTADILSLTDKISDEGAVCIVSPNKDKERRSLCRWLVERHTGMSIENKGLLLIFADKGLNQQHIRL